MSLEDLDEKTLRILKQFAPFGPDNLAPVFASKAVKDKGWSKLVGQEGDHLKLSLIQGSSNVMDGIAFGFGAWLPKVKSAPFHVCYHVEENVWNGVSKPQLRVLDMKMVES